MTILPEGNPSIQIVEATCKKCRKPGLLDARNRCERCVQRQREADQRKYAKHAEKIKARVKARKDADPEQKRQADRDYYARNADKLKDYQRQYNQANRGLVRERKRRYDQQDPERWKQYNKEYREQNAEKLTAEKRAYYEANRETLAAKKKEYFRANRHIKQINERNREARKKGAGGKFTPKQWLELCARYGNRCLCCGEQKKLTADHIVPLAKGGSNDISNIQPLCARCNSRKHTKTIDYRPHWEARAQQQSPPTTTPKGLTDA